MAKCIERAYVDDDFNCLLADFDLTGDGKSLVPCTGTLLGPDFDVFAYFNR